MAQQSPPSGDAGKARSRLKIFGIGCSALLGVCVFVAVIGALIGTDDQDAANDDEVAAVDVTATPETEPTATATPAPSPTPEAEPTPTPVPEPTATPESEPEPTEAPEPEPTPVEETHELPDGELTIYHFDVGQADATLVHNEDVTILIDAGDWQRDDLYGHIQSVGIDEIDIVIVTHPHADHIGQIPEVMANFTVGEVWMSGWEHDSQTFERALDAVLSSDAGYHEPRADETEAFGDVLVEVIHPVDPLSDVHDTVSVRISYGEFSAVYTGDAESQHESEMISRGHELSSTLLHLGHHGSNTSTSSAFLDAVSPEFAIYSAGVDNQYGHPHAEVVERVQDAGVHLYGTDVHGTIVVTTDGVSYDLDLDYEGDIIAAPEQPAEPEPEPEVESEPEPPAEDVPAGCVDINSAGFEELQQIDHIGPDRAQMILDLRPFASVDAMSRIEGIGPARLDDIKAQGVACVP